MLRPRIIPCLLLKDKGLVKTRKFKEPVYVGDPINAVRIFNEKEVDELIFLDITSTKEKKRPNLEFIKSIASECFMPFAYGGGIRSIDDAKDILKCGAEKIIVNSYFLENPLFIKDLSEKIGTQSVVVAIDVKRDFWGNYNIMTISGTKKNKINCIESVLLAEKLGAGEIFINSIDNDGMMQGYNINLIKMITSVIKIPLIACGGAGNLEHIKNVIYEGKASAAAAGSMFVFYKERNAVLINYPSKLELKEIYNWN